MYAHARFVGTRLHAHIRNGNNEDDDDERPMCCATRSHGFDATDTVSFLIILILKVACACAHVAHERAIARDPSIWRKKYHHFVLVCSCVCVYGILGVSHANDLHIAPNVYRIQHIRARTQSICTCSCAIWSRLECLRVPVQHTRHYIAARIALMDRLALFNDTLPAVNFKFYVN